MSIDINASGTVFRVDTGFDLSANTALDLIFTKPDGTTQVIISNPRVTAPAVEVSDPDLGTLNANEYMEFLTEVTDFDVIGVWTVCSKFTNTTPNPDKIHYGKPSNFKVVECEK